MRTSKQKRFSGPVTVFHERRLPERATPAGYAALIDAYDLMVPLPRTLSAIGEHHRIKEESGWRILTPRHAPSADLEGHLTFALKYEGLDLAVLNRLFGAVGARQIESLVRAKPTGSYARRIWFLYEWLTGKRLKLRDVERGTYAPAVDPEQQWAIEGQNSPRHRIRNNLPGTPAFCPLVFRTKALEQFIAIDLARRARAIAAEVPRDLLARTAAFLLLEDSKSSYAIEGERAPQDRIQRWGRAIGEAGRRPIDLDEILRLQAIVIGDARFVHLGLRAEGGFVGTHDRTNNEPIPDHISARPEDLASLVEGVIAYAARGVAGRVDPVVVAAAVAFGFVYVHPFSDGNGRLHRWLIHHVLAAAGYNPPGVVFPVSAAILRNIQSYREVLESHSRPLLDYIDWRAAPNGNIEVLNNTGDYYRYFDATAHAEFLYRCVEQTIERDLPDEVAYLQAYDRFVHGIQEIADMPAEKIELLHRFLRQENGRLSKRARENEFAGLTDEEAERIEALYRVSFEDKQPTAEA